MKKNSKQKKTFTKQICILLLVMAFIQSGFSQQEAVASIQEQEKKQAVDSIAQFMTDYYVFPDVGREMGEYVKSELKAGNYEDITDYNEFSNQLTEDLRSVSKDLHIGVNYAPEYVRMLREEESDETNTELEELEKREAAHANYSFKEMKILPGNVGYLKFNGFMDASLAGPTAVAAMNFLAHTDALIIDLRSNGGGSPSLIQLLTSYFFEDSEHLNSFYIREGDRTKQFWTLPHVPGPKMVDTKLYILTSASTFSGAEEFTYNLKNMERATVVGETTGGGAHPVSPHIINENYLMAIPFGRAINPITNTNWEGTGIEPHVKTSSPEAFNKAYLLSLESLLEDEKNKDYIYDLQWAYDGLNAKIEPFEMEEEILKQYIGTYGPRNITLENGSLYYQREGRAKMKMIPMKENMFMFDELEYFRLRFIVEDGKANAVEGNYDNGRVDKNERS